MAIVKERSNPQTTVGNHIMETEITGAWIHEKPSRSINRIHAAADAAGKSAKIDYDDIHVVWTSYRPREGVIVIPYTIW